MAESLENVASRFEFLEEGGLYAIIGPKGCGKSTLIENFDLCITQERDLKVMEGLVKNFIREHREFSKIALDEINPRFYKTGLFKQLCTDCKQTMTQIFIITANMRDLPPLVRSRIDYWFLFTLENNYLGYPPLNKLVGWKEPSRNKYTAIVAQFPEDESPEIWWYSKYSSKVEAKPEPIAVIEYKVIDRKQIQPKVEAPSVTPLDNPEPEPEPEPEPDRTRKKIRKRKDCGTAKQVLEILGDFKNILDAHFKAIDARMTVLDQRLSNMEQRLGPIEELPKVRSQLANIDKQLQEYLYDSSSDGW